MKTQQELEARILKEVAPEITKTVEELVYTVVFSSAIDLEKELLWLASQIQGKEDQDTTLLLRLAILAYLSNKGKEIIDNEENN